MNQHEDVETVVLTEEEIQDRVASSASGSRTYYGDEPVLLVAVLRGAAMFVADLARAMTCPVEIDFMAVSSYGTSTQVSGVVRILKDLDEDIEGRHVLVVEDILDTGLTLKYLLKNLASRKPASLEVVTLLHKQGKQRVPYPVSTSGSRSPTSSSSAMALTTPRGTGTCPTSAS